MVEFIIYYKTTLKSKSKVIYLLKTAEPFNKTSAIVLFIFIFIF